MLFWLLITATMADNLLQQVLARVQAEGVGWLSRVMPAPVTHQSLSVPPVAVEAPGLHGRPVRRVRPPVRLSPSVSPDRARRGCRDLATRDISPFHPPPGALLQGDRLLSAPVMQTFSSAPPHGSGAEATPPVTVPQAPVVTQAAGAVAALSHQPPVILPPAMSPAACVAERRPVSAVRRSGRSRRQSPVRRQAAAQWSAGGEVGGASRPLAPPPASLFISPVSGRLALHSGTGESCVLTPPPPAPSQQVRKPGQRSVSTAMGAQISSRESDSGPCDPLGPPQAPFSALSEGGSSSSPPY